MTQFIRHSLKDCQASKKAGKDLDFSDEQKVVDWGCVTDD
jgi:hypothetical protein